ncbi:MAG TPA: hypothetical protein VK487_09485 [Candidatus Bathyarchaeia archaeon]|nr:hypothetical protein [Candidatus Bathyarchaeia archaeon]
MSSVPGPIHHLRTLDRVKPAEERVNRKCEHKKRACADSIDDVSINAEGNSP